MEGRRRKRKEGREGRREGGEREREEKKGRREGRDGLAGESTDRRFFQRTQVQFPASTWSLNNHF